MDQVRDHLKEYLDRSCRVVSGNQATIDENLYLLIIQCLEVSIRGYSLGGVCGHMYRMEVLSLVGVRKYINFYRLRS